MLDISIAAPAYNEGENIFPVVEKWVRYLETKFKPADYEIVVCNDGSRDNTGEMLDDLARRYPSVRPCRHVINQGAAAALATAIGQTTKSWILLLDSDGQYPIENLERFLHERDRTSLPAYIGFRPHKADSAFARFGSWASGWCCNLAHGTAYRDFNCALKLVEGRLLREIRLEAKGLNYSTEISSKILERVVVMGEVECLHEPRQKGRSSRTLIRGSWARFLFVSYIGWRQLLLRTGVLQRNPYTP